MATKKEPGFTIALPSGKSLEAPTLELLKRVGVTVNRRHPRAIAADVDGIPRLFTAIFCRPDQVGVLVQAGVAEYGITGKDIMIENPQANVEILAELPYSRLTAGGPRCVLFTHHEHFVRSLEMVKRLPRRRAKDGHVLLGDRVVASEYPVETKAFLDANGIDIPVVPTKSAEVMVYTRICQYGVALIETGTTRDVNRLVEIEDGTIFESCSVLVANKERGGTWVPSGYGYVRLHEFLPALLCGACNALNMVYLLMNAPVDKVEEIRKMLPSLKSPTVQPLADLGFCSIGAVVPAKDVNLIIWALREHEATGFVTLPPSTVM